MIELTEERKKVALNPLAVIDRILGDLELTPQQYELAKSSYEHIAKILGRRTSIVLQFSPDIFPQGSVRLGTTVRPFGRDKFDLDMVCKLMIAGKSEVPNTVYNLVWDALGQDDVCKKIREKKSRCIRLAPESSKFYLDVVPAIPDWNHKSSLLLVPDRDLKIWSSTHPIGYADDWFKPITERIPAFRLLAFANEAQAMNRARVETMPEYGQFEIKPLQRIVQMLKFIRNRFFQNDQENQLSSILLTTIIAQSYLDTLDESIANLVEFVAAVARKLPNYIEVDENAEGKKYTVLNPVNELENFAENWTPKKYARFMQWHSQINRWAHNLRNTSGIGTDGVYKLLQESFDNDLVVKAANAIGTDTRNLHDEGQLKVDNVAG
jgi:hypothetical protein